MAEESFSADDLAVLGGNEGDGGADKTAEKVAEADKGGKAESETPADKGAKVEGEKPAEKVEAEKPADKAEKKPDAKVEEKIDKALEKLAWPEDGFPDDWRERTLKSLGLEGDALKRAQEVAKRAASPAELLRSVMTGTTKITELTAELKGKVTIPGDKAKPEEIDAFRKAWGVPEAADKYDLKDLGEMSEVDKEIWGEVLPGFHKGNFSQTQLGQVAAALKTAETIAAKRMEERATKIDGDTRDMLLLEYGSSRAVKANEELANRYLGDLLGKHMEKEDRTDFLNRKLEDGTRIGSHPGFVKAIIEAARQWAPEGLPEIGEGGQQVDVDKRINDIVKLSHSQKPDEKKEYQRLQPELQRLIAAKNRRDAGGRK